MGRTKDLGRLNHALSEHLCSIHDTLQIMDQTPVSSLKKASWDEVIKIGEQVSKQATMAGMLWTGSKPEVKVLEENMESYFNVLRGLLLLSHSSSAGAGPTLSSNIHASIKQVVDCSFMLWKESVSSLASSTGKGGLSIPQIVGTVWEACASLKKTPSSNVVAIGRAMTQVAVSIKDVLRELQELEPASPSPAKEVSATSSSQQAEDQQEDCSGDDDVEDTGDDDLGNDLSPEEMKIAQLAIKVVSETLGMLKELIRSITGLVKQESLKERGEGTESIEKLLKLSQNMSVQIDEIGACLYPPQELSSIRVASGKMGDIVDEVGKELSIINGSTDGFSQACSCLKEALASLTLGLLSDSGSEEEELKGVDEVLPLMKKLSVG